MSDLDKLKQLFDEWGVGYSEGVGVSQNIIITCMQGEAKITGYMCFFTEFEFDKDGKFIEMGAGE